MLCKGKDLFSSGKEKRHLISIFKINSRRLKPARRSDGFEIRRQKNDLTSLESADLQSAASKIANPFLPIQVRRIANPPYPKWSNIPYAGFKIRWDTGRVLLFIIKTNDNPFFLSSWLACSAYEGLGANPRDPPARGYLPFHYKNR